MSQRRSLNALAGVLALSVLFSPGALASVGKVAVADEFDATW